MPKCHLNRIEAIHSGDFEIIARHLNGINIAGKRLKHCIKSRRICYHRSIARACPWYRSRDRRLGYRAGSRHQKETVGWEPDI